MLVNSCIDVVVFELLKFCCSCLLHLLDLSWTERPVVDLLMRRGSCEDDFILSFLLKDVVETRVVPSSGEDAAIGVAGVLCTDIFR